MERALARVETHWNGPKASQELLNTDIFEVASKGSSVSLRISVTVARLICWLRTEEIAC